MKTIMVHKMKTFMVHKKMWIFELGCCKYFSIFDTHANFPGKHCFSKRFKTYMKIDIL